MCYLYLYMYVQLGLAVSKKKKKKQPNNNTNKSLFKERMNSGGGDKKGVQPHRVLLLSPQTNHSGEETTLSLSLYCRTWYPKGYRNMSLSLPAELEQILWLCFPTSGLYNVNTFGDQALNTLRLLQYFKGCPSVTSPKPGFERGDTTSHFLLVWGIQPILLSLHSLFLIISSGIKEYSCPPPVLLSSQGYQWAAHHPSAGLCLTSPSELMPSSRLILNV